MIQLGIALAVLALYVAAVAWLFNRLRLVVAPPKPRPWNPPGNPNPAPVANDNPNHAARRLAA